MAAPPAAPRGSSTQGQSAQPQSTQPQSTRPIPAQRLSTQLTRFVLVGAVAFVVDLSCYQTLLALGLWVHLAKALAFVAGTTTAYLINRRWTFQSRGSRAEYASIVALYAITFVVQVGMNAVMLAVLPPFRGEITCAFVIAQGLATAINFIVQRTVIFRR